MREPKDKVTGAACLNYIDRGIGFAYRNRQSTSQTASLEESGALDLHITGGYDIWEECYVVGDYYQDATTCFIWSHNENIRKVGLVLDQYDDGGMLVAILSTDRFNTANVRYFANSMGSHSSMPYESDPLQPEYKADRNRFASWATFGDDTCRMYLYDRGKYKTLHPTTTDFSAEAPVDFDEAINYVPYITQFNRDNGDSLRNMTFNGQEVFSLNAELTTNKNTTLQFGFGYNMPANTYIKGDYCAPPLDRVTGNMYEYLHEIYNGIGTLAPPIFTSSSLISDYDVQYGEILESGNGMCFVYNIILTESESQALSYLQTGTPPTDAWLYPIDWENLPSYNPDSGDDNPDSDDDIPDSDAGRDITPNLPVVPTYTPAMLSNNNYYWLTVNEWDGFVNWFWNDIGHWSDFDDFIAEVSGLYNDLASAILMVRYMPISSDAHEIGGLASQPSNILLGQIEKAGTYSVISKTTAAPIIEVGNVAIDDKFNNFLDHSPYSMVSLYLPYHGFVDLDIDILTGHTLYIKCVFDMLSGALMYMLYCDNQMLMNTYVCKCAVDIPITLQSKSDRDSAIFSNITNAMTGVAGGVTSLATGNPIGAMVGVSALSAGNASAPLNVKGTVGETLSYYAPQQCALIIRRPTISKPSNYKSIVGQMCGRAYTLYNLRGKGLTTVYNPRLTFSKTVPMQSEVDEIYDYLEKGVIL